MSKPWSRAEDEAIVADYFAMLESELRDEPVNKAAHRRALAPLLDHRSEASIERKHQNISAILIELGCVYIDGYKPLVNYQAELATVVAERLDHRPALLAILRIAVDQVAIVPSVDDILSRLVAPPRAEHRLHRFGRENAAPRPARRVDFLARESRNSSLGRAGEEFAVNFERARLLQAGRARLADRVEHVAVTQGDGLGYDIHSFEPSGKDRLIEVKTTAYGPHIPFYVSRNELRFSKQEAEMFHLYRLFHFRRDPYLFALSGALNETCTLDAVVYAAQAN